MAPEKRPFTLRLGVKQYDISEEEYLDPGKLVDSVCDEVSMEGVFIARLNTWKEEDGHSNVKQVKDALKADASLDTFHPEWLKRTTVVYRKAFEIIPEHDQTLSMDSDEISEEARREAKSKLRRLQTSMRKKIEETDFASLTDESSDLGMALASRGVSDCLDVICDTLEGKSNDVVYLTNVTMDHFLKTTGTASMCSMKTNLEGLAHKDISGITKPTVYIGNEYATFCCHREDMAFCAINRHISGAPKIWHCVPPRFYGAFVRFLLMLPIPEESRSKLCYLQHKVAWVDPRMVMKAGIPVYTVIQRPGDIVVLLPYTVHLGFNINLNLNEACNFVSQRWILPGLIAKQRCLCNKKYYVIFELRQVLKDLHADPMHIRAWEMGMLPSLIAELKKEQPLLYPHLRDMFDEPVDKALLLGCTRTEEEEPHHLHHLQNQFQEALFEDLAREEEEGESSSGKPKCTRCDYCPNRHMGDAPERIFAHAKKCHGEEAAKEVLLEVKAKYGKASRIFKCPPIKCERCGQTIRGNVSNLKSHQNSSRCLKPQTNTTEGSSCSKSKRRRL